MRLVKVNGNDGLFGLITSLINNRLRQDRVHRHTVYAEKTVVKLLGLNTVSNLEGLAKVLGEECDIFDKEKEGYNSKLFGFDYKCPEALRNLIEAGYVRIECRKTPEKIYLNSFKRLVEEAVNNRNLYVPPQKRLSTLEIFVLFDIDKLARENLTMLPEIDLMTFVCNSVYNGLKLLSETKTLPVKPSRKRKGSDDVWCQLRHKFYTNSMDEDSITFAKNELGIDKSCLSKRTRVEVFFALRDTVDPDNQWASCPLLHVGTNFKTADISQSFYDDIPSSRTHTDNIISLRNTEGDRERNVCCVYSQKNPTLEIPAKLHEAEVIVRFSLKEAHKLYIAKQRVSDSLTINLAFCHPKARMRYLFMVYVTCIFAKSVTNYDRPYVDRHSNEIFLGKHTVLAAAENYKVSRKISLPSDICYACNNEKCRNCGGLVHDNNLPCDQQDFINDTTKLLTNKILSVNKNAERYTMKPCERASVLHSYFCKKVRAKAPITPNYNFRDNQRTKLILYGKVKDIVVTNKSLFCDTESLRKRIFYHKEDDLKDKDIVEWFSDKSFRDIMIREVSVQQAEQHFARNDFPEKIYDALETMFKKLEESNPAGEAKIIVDSMCRLLPKAEIEAGVYSKVNVMKATRCVIALLRAVNQRNQATLFTMMNKSMVTESTLVMIGARCAVSDIVTGNTLIVRQFVGAPMDLEVALVSQNDLEKYTVTKGSVSATTAPNDKLSNDACQTWRREEKKSIRVIPLKPAEKYIPPHLR